jgi:ubiquinone/menaquinone biosynthesis C-methylase UbiE
VWPVPGATDGHLEGDTTACAGAATSRPLHGSRVQAAHIHPAPCEHLVVRFDAAAVRHAYEAIVDGYAERFGDDVERSAFDRSVLDDAVELLAPSALVLDLGCGPGQVASYLSGRGCRALGVDLTPAMLYVARRLHPQMPLIGGDALRLPARDGVFDGIVAWFSLHNLPRSLLDQALREVRRVLRREGIFVMVTHGGEGEESVEQERHATTEHVLITYYDLDTLRSTLARHELSVVDVRSRPPLEHEHAVTKLFVTATAGARRGSIRRGPLA